MVCFTLAPRFGGYVLTAWIGPDVRGGFARFLLASDPLTDLVATMADAVERLTV